MKYWEIEVKTSVRHMPLEIVNGYPCKFCSGRDLEVEKDITYYWIETNLILREKITDYKCKNCKVVLIRVTKHKEEDYR